MIASVAFSGVFLWIGSIVLVLLLASRRIREVLCEEPPADVEGEVEAGEYRSTVRGMTS
jgi:hypothetical protein